MVLSSSPKKDSQSSDFAALDSSSEGLLRPINHDGMSQTNHGFGDSEGETLSTVTFKADGAKKATVSPSLPWYPCHMSQSDFKKTVAEVREALNEGVNPVRIQQGSSGSYFVRNRNGEIVAVFKPKNEEPYGNLNPKWTKWFHKNCLPCCFGRSCLIPNLGYISEAAASIVDRHLGLHIVPRTEIVELSSSAFHYGYWTKQAAKKGAGFPAKVGSFQIFVKGFLESSRQLGKISVSTCSSLKSKFRSDFERLVILDYIIRNTDRGSDNWLVFYSEEERESTSATSIESKSEGSIKIAAIDNGLAFPHKHPDNWRSYPYGWSALSAAKVPFSKETIDSFLPVLSDHSNVEVLVSKLQKCFSLDSDFDEEFFHRQMAVMRGQIHNLVDALSNAETPYQLLKRPLMQVHVTDVDEDNNVQHEVVAPSNETVTSRTKRILVELVKKRPCFKYC